MSIVSSSKLPMYVFWKEIAVVTKYPDWKSFLSGLEFLLKSNIKMECLRLNMKLGHLRSGITNSIFHGLAENTTLKELDLAGNIVSPTDIICLSRALKVNQHLKILGVGRFICQSDEHSRAAEAIQEALTYNKAIKVLHLRF